MTTRAEIITQYGPGEEYSVPYLDHGFVAIMDHMGSDASIVQAARISYQKGTRTVSDDRALLRYLVSHRHTSPLEQGVVQFHLKMPIFVMRQHIRHRMSSPNEVSARYSELPEEFYIPQDLLTQSETNKQGSSGNSIDYDRVTILLDKMEASGKGNFALYHELLEAGVARETAREVLPLNTYTECIWKIDLHNFFHYVKLRLDPHAQSEIRQLAAAMYELVKHRFPIACEAFEDYQLHAKTFSRMEMEYLRSLLNTFPFALSKEDRANVKSGYGLTERELNDFFAKITSTN